MHFINFETFDILIRFTILDIRVSPNFSNSSKKKGYLKKLQGTKKKISKKSVEKCPSASRAAEEVAEAH